MDEEEKDITDLSSQSCDTENESSKMSDDTSTIAASADFIERTCFHVKSCLCNLTIGLVNLHCADQNRVSDEMWYTWDNEFYSLLKTHHSAMKEILNSKSHKELREACFHTNPLFWSDSTAFKTNGVFSKNLDKLLTEKQKLIDDEDFITQWGKIQFKSPFQLISEKILKKKDKNGLLIYKDIKDRLWKERDQYYHTKKNNLISLFNNLLQKF